MNDVINLLLSRRSVRNYRPEQIQKEDLDLILQTALYAPNGGNHQVPRFIVIQDKHVVLQLKTLARQRLAVREVIPGQYQNKSIIQAKNDENYDCTKGAPTVVLVVAPAAHGNSMADCANAIQNMQIAATSMNLGACWINQPHWLTDDSDFRAFAEGLGMKREENIFGGVIFGYPSKPPDPPTPRKEGRIVFIQWPLLTESAGRSVRFIQYGRDVHVLSKSHDCHNDPRINGNDAQQTTDLKNRGNQGIGPHFFR